MLNMATTTNYGFEIPDDTDLVKDGALAMRDLGQDVDTTLATALNANDYAGLVLVKKQTIGSAVSSVTVTDAFSATYNNYFITLYSVPSIANLLTLRLGATATGYFSGVTIANYGASPVTTTLVTNNGTSWDHYATGFGTSSIQSAFTLLNPFASTQTSIQGSRNALSGYGASGGHLNDTTSYSDFTFTTSGGTITGGTICVYGYGIS
jgi:hypothetical protein